MSGRIAGVMIGLMLIVCSTALAEDKGTFWELLDKADLKVVTDPWPAKAGAATLKAEITTNDDEQKFSGTLEYRISSSEQNSEAWKPMNKTGQDKDGSTHFEAPITLSKGSWYIQFRVRTGGKDTPLTDWKVDVP